MSDQIYMIDVSGLHVVESTTSDKPPIRWTQDGFEMDTTGFDTFTSGMRVHLPTGMKTGSPLPVTDPENKMIGWVTAQDVDYTVERCRYTLGTAEEWAELGINYEPKPRVTSTWMPVK